AGSRPPPDRERHYGETTGERDGHSQIRTGPPWAQRHTSGSRYSRRRPSLIPSASWRGGPRRPLPAPFLCAAAPGGERDTLGAGASAVRRAPGLRSPSAAAAPGTVGEGEGRMQGCRYEDRVFLVLSVAASR